MADPFEVRMQFLSHLHKLNASQQSIQKVVGYALKYYSKCGDDLWSCITDECRDGSINVRINILYLLDSLGEASLQSVNIDRAQHRPSKNGSYYIHYIARDLDRIVEYVVPDSREGLMNVQSTAQILESWRIRRLIDLGVIDSAIATLNTRKESIQKAALELHGTKKGREHMFSRNEVVRRIEEDRERHKLLRERRWVQQIDRSENSHQTLASFLPLNSNVSQNPPEAMEVDNDQNSEPVNAQPVQLLPIDVEFENAWETTSDWNDDDIDAVDEEVTLCFPTSNTNTG